MHDHLEGQALLGQQDELVTVFLISSAAALSSCLDGRMELESRRSAAAAPGSGGELRLEVVDELAAARLAEEPGAFVLDLVIEIMDVQVAGVVQVGHPTYRVPVLVQGSDEVGQVFAVATHLHHRVKLGPLPHAGHQDELGVLLVQLGLAPLLELDDQVGVGPRAPVTSGEDDVRPLAG
ncbi:hypothetical protein ACFSTC_03570 [Nonomuraea ferruginea]